MLLTPEEVLQRLEKPAATALLQQGRADERRHRRHIEGDPALVWEFLLTCRPDDLISTTEYDELKKIIKAATKPIYSSLINVRDKVFTASGTTRYFDFARPQLQEDWQQYVKDYAPGGLYRSFEKKWGAASLTGFQGVFLVDLPAAPEPGMPRPFWRYVPSQDIYDIEVTDEAVVYLALQGATVDGKTEYYCWDGEYCHRVRHEGGKYVYLQAETTRLGLGYVPAYPVTNRKPKLQEPARRTSHLSESLELADVYLVDFNNLQWGKRFHSFQKFWSYGVKCEYLLPGGEDAVPTLCNEGWHERESGKVKCPNCGGRGRYVPVGADKTYIVQTPQSKEDPTITPPAGYIRPELDSPKFIAEELKTNEARIEKAVLGKEGILTQQTKVETATGKDMDMGPVYDRLSSVSEDLEQAEQFVYGTMCRLRYADGFRDLQNTRGRRYQVKSVAQLEAEYGAAKQQGLDEATLYPYLEDIIYTKWAGDPMELQRNLLKLQLTPFPTCTVAEARADGVATADDLALKRYLNDFVVRFEEENGSILEFGSALSPAEKLRRIRAVFSTYLAEKAAQPAFLSFLPPINSPAPLPASGAAFAIGDTVMVKAGKAHMPEHEGLPMTIAQIQGNTYAVRLPDGSVHKWYTAEELMGMSPAGKSVKKPEMAM